MEENKNKEDCKTCDNCPVRCGCILHNKCGNLGRCQIMKKIIWIIILIIVFCLGVQYGQLKSESRGGYRMYQGKMMDWDYKNIRPETNRINNQDIEVTPEATQ